MGEYEGHREMVNQLVLYVPKSAGIHKRRKSSSKRPRTFKRYCRSKGHRGVNKTCIKKGLRSPSGTRRKQARRAAVHHAAKRLRRHIRK
jgi:hypothetical protein